MTEEIQHQLNNSFYTACPDAILILNKGVIAACNSSASSFFQATEKELVGKKLIDFIQKENITETELDNHLNIGLENTNYFECSIQNSKGQKNEVRIFLIKVNSEEKTFTQVLIRDITAQKETERSNELLVKKLKEQHRKTTAITDVLDKSAIISMTDKEGLITKVNEDFCQISKYSQEELLGKNHNIVNSGFHGKEFWQHMWRDISRGKTWRKEVKNKAKDGSFYWVDTVINPILDENGKIDGYLSIRYLITDKKEKEFEITIRNEELVSLEEELRQNLEELETQRDYVQEINEEIKVKSATLEKNTQVLLDLNRSDDTHTGNLDTAFELITKTVAQNLGIERVGIWKYDSQFDKIVSQKQYQKSKTGNEFIQSADISKTDVPTYFGNVVSEQNIVAHDAKNHPALVEFVDSYLNPLKINSMLDIPYFLHGKLAGVICCETQNQYKNWTVEDISFVKGVADIITIAIKTKQQVEEQEKVKESERLLYQFLDKIPIGIAIIGSNKTMIYSNEISKEIFPYGLNPKDGPETANYKLTIAGTDIPYPKEKFPSSNVFKGISSSCNDIEIVQNGKRTPIEITASPVYSETGEILYAIAAVQDITERKAKENELRYNLEELQATQESLLETQLEQQKLVSVIKHVDAFVAITDMQGNTDFLNEKGKVLSGFGENYKGKHISEFHDAEGAKIAAEVIMPTIMQQGFWKGEHQLQNQATKELFETIANVFIIQDPITQQPIALATVQVDITEQKQLEKAVKEQNQILQATQEALLETQQEQEKLVSIIQNVNALVAIADMEGKAQFLNKKGQELSGFGEAYKNVSIAEFHSEQYSRMAMEVMVPAVMQNGFWKGEHKLQNCITKEEIDTLVDIFVIKDPITQQPIGLATVQVDITEQKQLEKSIQEQNERLQASEEELRQNMEELQTTQELMEQKQYVIEDNKAKLEKQNGKLEANEAVLKKAFTKMKEQDLKLRESLDALQTQEEELRQNMEELQTTQEVMAYQKDILEISNRQITKSISYAQTIQNAFLPSKRLIKHLLPESFIIYKPKDIVSGDFYWLSEYKDKILIGTIDCTGHGVPGAFMSLVASNILNEIISQREIIQPSIILQELHKGVVKKLNQKEGANNDGMDLTLCLIEKTAENETQLTFAGVKQNLYIVRNQTLIELKGNRHSIGGSNRDEDRCYTQEQIMLQKDDSVFLATDGYADQANGERKSFSKKRFRETLLEIGHLPAKEQKKILENILTEHQKQTDQRDDITVFGFKI